MFLSVYLPVGGFPLLSPVQELLLLCVCMCVRDVLYVYTILGVLQVSHACMLVCLCVFVEFVSTKYKQEKVYFSTLPYHFLSPRPVCHMIN